MNIIIILLCTYTSHSTVVREKSHLLHLKLEKKNGKLMSEEKSLTGDGLVCMRFQRVVSEDKLLPVN